MDAGKQRYHYNNEYYMEGNTARELQVVPKYPEEEEQGFRKQPVREVRRNTRVNTSIDMFSLLVLTIAMVATLFTSIGYLKVQSNITQTNKQIAESESKLLKIQNQNSAALSKINTSLDLNYIYQVATNDLGMVYPDDNQVITYESTLSDYVKQYEDIPEETATTLLDGILR